MSQIGLHVADLLALVYAGLSSLFFQVKHFESIETKRSYNT